MQSLETSYLRSKYFLKNYMGDMIVTIITIGVLLIPDVTYLKIHPLDLYVLDISILNISVFDILKVGSIIISLFIVISLRMKDKGFYFVSFTKKKDKNDWLGQGIFDYEKSDNCYSIVNSESGYIYSKCLTYSNYEFSFNFKIKKCLEVIVRAKDLSNYIMLQIHKNIIEPHIKINGKLISSEDKDLQSILHTSDFTKIEINSNLSQDKWYKCIILCNKESINIKLLDNNNYILLDKQLSVPKGNMPFRFITQPEPIYLSINLEYGSIGFRNCTEEKAFIKNMLIQNI